MTKTKPKAKRSGVPLHVYIPAELMTKLRKEVEKRGYPVNVTSVVRFALEQELRK